jgi:hypothetical protein
MLFTCFWSSNGRRRETDLGMQQWRSLTINKENDSL